MSNTSRRDFLKTLSLGASLAPMATLTQVNTWLNDEWMAIDFNAFEDFRSQFMLSDEINYLNHASIGTIPKTIHKVHTEFLALCETNPWLHMWGGAWEEPREEVRRKAASFINAKPEEITISHNTTEVFNLLGMGLPLGPGDEVLFSNLNHPGASVPFDYHSKRKGYKVVNCEIPIGKIEQLSKDEIVDFHLRKVTPSTKLIVLPHIDNTVGLRTPINDIAAAARKKGVQWIAIDAAQTVGMIPVDVRELDIDVMATSAHKWIQAPKGVSVSYINEGMLDVLEPMWVTWGQNRWKETARRYEDYGTRNLAATLTMGASIDFQNNINQTERNKHLIKLRDFTMEVADKHPNAEWKSSRDWDLSGSLYAIGIKNEKASEFADRLFKDHGTIVRPFDAPELNSVRIAPNLMNTEEDVLKLFRQIK